jgi:hypothetical protein
MLQFAEHGKSLFGVLDGPMKPRSCIRNVSAVGRFVFSSTAIKRSYDLKCQNPTTLAPCHQTRYKPTKLYDDIIKITPPIETLP